MTRHFKLKKGLDLPINGAPDQTIQPGGPVERVALLGSDYVGMKPTMLVAEGDTVALGEPLFEDKKNPGVMFTSPGSGTVEAINRGKKRVLQTVVIKLDGDKAVKFDTIAPDAVASAKPEQVRETLIKSGLWTALRTRPYSKSPAVEATPSAIFVTAIDTNPLAADPAVIIAEQPEAFAHGIALLSKLADGALVHVCKAPDANLPHSDNELVQTSTFEGPHPAGLVGTHIHLIDPVGVGKSAWHIGYQDVIAIGKLFADGVLWTDRVVAIAGPSVKQPRLVRTRQGACINAMLDTEALEESCARPISGSLWSGRRVHGWASYLGRFHTQLTVIPEATERQFMGWVRPGGDKFSVLNVFFSALQRASRRFAFNTAENGSPRAMVPLGNYEKVMPLDILATQLLRAILVRDTDSAQELGVLELDEEDLALCSFVCVGKYNFGPHLRASLEQIEVEG